MHNDIVDEALTAHRVNAIEHVCAHQHLKIARQSMQTEWSCDWLVQALWGDHGHQLRRLRCQLQLMVSRAQVERAEKLAARQPCSHLRLVLDWKPAFLSTVIKASIIAADAPRIWPLRRLLRRYDGTGVRSSTWPHPAILDALLRVLLNEICNPRAARSAHRRLRLHFSTVAVTF